VVIFRRTDGWMPMRLPVDAEEFELVSLGLRVRIDEIYQGIVPAA
jgi:hypothetical protein